MNTNIAEVLIPKEILFRTKNEEFTDSDLEEYVNINLITNTDSRTLKLKETRDWIVKYDELYKGILQIHDDMVNEYDHIIKKYQPINQHQNPLIEVINSLKNTSLESDHKPLDMLESEFEELFVKEIESKGGVCWKLNPYKNISGLPDRLVVLSDNKFGFVELKRPNGKERPRPNQVEKLNQLKKLTDHVYVLNHPDDMNNLIEDIEKDNHSELRWVAQ